MTALDFIKWAMDEHPFVFLISVYSLSWGIAGLGRIGSTSVRVKHKIVKEPKS